MAEQKYSGRSNPAGRVILAGAGPGDVNLLTLRTAELIEMADVIVYDALISAEILSRIPKGKETIYVGKHSGDHTVPQGEINQILIRKAREGRTVLRLKGGDPFVFGRGGEELELVKEAGIPFEVVPGVTSAAAVPAYAGIPLTHRDYASSFHVITGHRKKDGSLNIDFRSLVNAGGTLVFLMGVSSMSLLMRGLTDAGMDRDMPAAVVERGTTAGQRKVTATVGTLCEAAASAKIGTPAVIVVGRVCMLSERLSWTKERVLGGRQFLITRPRQNLSALARRLRNLGAQVIELPAICTEPIRENSRLKDALLRFSARAGEEWLVFTSPIGVQTFFEQLREMKLDIRTLFGGQNRQGESFTERDGRKISCARKVAAIGSGTEAELELHGIFPDVVPKMYSAAALGRALAKQAAKESHITVVRAEKGSEELFPPLIEAGLKAEDVPLYRTVYETHGFLKEKLKEMFQNGEIDAVTFTSASTVKGFVRAMEGLDFSDIRAVCIGEQTAGAAKEWNMQVSVAGEATVDAMVEKIVEAYGNR